MLHCSYDDYQRREEKRKKRKINRRDERGGEWSGIRRVASRRDERGGERSGIRRVASRRVASRFRLQLTATRLETIPERSRLPWLPSQLRRQRIGPNRHRLAPPVDGMLRLLRG